MFHRNDKRIKRRFQNNVHEREPRTSPHPEVVNETGCIGVLSRDKKFVVRRVRNKPFMKVRTYDVINYADEMYDDLYIPIPSEERASRRIFKETGNTDIFNSSDISNKSNDKFGRFHLIQSSQSTSRSKVSFDTVSTSLMMTSSSNDSTSRNKYQNVNDVRDQQRRYDNYTQNIRTKLELIEEYPKENLMKFTPAPSYPRDNYFPPVSDDNVEEINSLVQNEIKQRYSYEDFKRMSRPPVKKKLWSSNTNNNLKESCLNPNNNEIYANQINTISNGQKQTDESENVATVQGDPDVLIRRHTKADDSDVYDIMKRKRFTQEKKMKSLNNEIVKSVDQISEHMVSVDTSDESVDDLCVASPDTFDENFESDFYQTATILGEENRDEPDTVVVVTGRIQGVRVRERPREPYTGPRRVYYNYDSDVQETRKEPLPKPSRLYLTHENRNEVNIPVLCVRV